MPGFIDGLPTASDDGRDRGLLEYYHFIQTPTFRC